MLVFVLEIINIYLACALQDIEISYIKFLSELTNIIIGRNYNESLAS